MLAFTGVRGVVSLAAALAIPLTIASGAPFPHRDLILFVTFGVIIITLVGQGLMLPTVIRWLGVGAHGKAEHRREQEAELAARNAAIQRVAASSGKTRQRAQSERRRSSSSSTRVTITASGSSRPIWTADSSHALGNDVRAELIEAERNFLYELLRDGKITDESRRRLERDLDLEEAAILARREGMTPLGLANAPPPLFFVFRARGGPHPVFLLPSKRGDGAPGGARELRYGSLGGLT